MDDESISSRVSKTKSNSSVVRPRPNEGRVIGLPSTTSTGLWAVRDEHNVNENNHRQRPPPTDLGYINNTELSMLQNLNEDLQRRIASLDIQRNDALLASEEAEIRIKALSTQIDSLSNEHEIRESELLDEIDQYKQKIQQQSEMLSDWPRRVATAEASLEIEKMEVARAVKHARNAGQAADKANQQLAAEQRLRESLEQELRDLSEQGSAVSQTVIDEAIDRACSGMKQEIEELQNRCADLEEDAETEREWREAAQKERNEAVERCLQLQQHAELMEASVGQVKSESLELHQKLEKLRLEAENAESKKEEDEKARKERIRKRLRDQQSEAYHAKQSDKAKLTSLEHEITKLKLENEDYPRIQQALRQEKRRNAALHTQVRELTSRLRSLGQDVQGGESSVAKTTPRDTSPVVASSPSRRNKPVISNNSPSVGYDSSSTSSSKKQQSSNTHKLKSSSPIQSSFSKASLLHSNLKNQENIHQVQEKKIASQMKIDRKKSESKAGYPPKNNKPVSQADDFDFDDDEEDDNMYEHNYDADDITSMYGGEDDEKRIYLDQQARGPRKHVLQARDYQQRAVADAASMPGSDAPDWLRDD